MKATNSAEKVVHIYRNTQHHNDNFRIEFGCGTWWFFSASGVLWHLECHVFARFKIRSWQGL